MLWSDLEMLMWFRIENGLKSTMNEKNILFHSELWLDTTLCPTIALQSCPGLGNTARDVSSCTMMAAGFPWAQAMLSYKCKILLVRRPEFCKKFLKKMDVWKLIKQSQSFFKKSPFVWFFPPYLFFITFATILKPAQHQTSSTEISMSDSPAQTCFPVWWDQ